MTRLHTVVGGSIGGGSWSISMNHALSAQVASYSTLLGAANAVQTALAASAAFKNGFNSDTTALTTKMLHYPTNGGAANLVAESTAASFVGAGGPVHAPQVCVVASFRTDTAGRSGRGRSYWPYRGAAISSAGIVSSAGQTSVSASVAAMTSAIVTAMAALPIAASWSVWSPATQAMRPITRILIGNQCDTQRRRNDNRDEVFTPFTPPVTNLALSDDVNEEFAAAVRNAKITQFGDLKGDGPEFLQAAVDFIVP